MATTKAIKIFIFLDIEGEPFEVCLCAAPDINCQEVPQWCIITAQENPKNPGRRLWQRLSYPLPDEPTPPRNQFYMKLDYKRHTPTDSGIQNVRDPNLVGVVTVTEKRMRELKSESDDTSCYDSANLEFLVVQNIVKIVREGPHNKKSKFVLVECLLPPDELIRKCECCSSIDPWEDPLVEKERFKYCGRCTAQKVAYCSKKCQKRHWNGVNPEVKLPHKVYCGKDLAETMRIIQRARSQFIATGVESGARRVQVLPNVRGN